ncbi:MAG: hypothetical protein AAB400_04790, partial [Patescibacteria group bacterium]
MGQSFWKFPELDHGDNELILIKPLPDLIIEVPTYTFSEVVLKVKNTGTTAATLGPSVKLGLRWIDAQGNLYPGYSAKELSPFTANQTLEPNAEVSLRYTIDQSNQEIAKYFFKQIDIPLQSQTVELTIDKTNAIQNELFENNNLTTANRPFVSVIGVSEGSSLAHTFLRVNVKNDGTTTVPAQMPIKFQWFGASNQAINGNNSNALITIEDSIEPGETISIIIQRDSNQTPLQVKKTLFTDIPSNARTLEVTTNMGQSFWKFPELDHGDNELTLPRP